MAYAMGGDGPPTLVQTTTTFAGFGSVGGTRGGFVRIGRGSPITAGGERISGSKSVVFIESVGAGTPHSLGLDLDHSCRQESGGAHL